jgi:hypothetical protein
MNEATTRKPPFVASSPIRRIWRRSHAGIVLSVGFGALLLLAVPAQAGFIMSLDNVTGPSAGTGTFEVWLTNTNLLGGDTYDVAAFSFELSLPTGSGVQFTSATTSTVGATYLFQGTGGASIDPSFTLSLDSFPNSSFSGSDTEFTYPSIPVGPGASFGLGFVSYAVSPQAMPGDVQISFISDGTSVSDANGLSIPGFRSDDSQGIIHINGGNATVPEPSSFILMSAGILLAVMAGCRRH